MSRIIPSPPMDPEEKKHLPVLKEKEDPPVSIRLDGTALTEAGQLTKHKYFEFLNLDLEEYNIEFTPEEAKRIRGHLGKMSTGSTSMTPQICSPSCPWKNRCPLYQINKHPLGLPCLVEVNLLREWTTAYFNEYQVDPNSFTEISMINELAEIEVMQWRLNMIIARPENIEMTTENIVGVSRDGDPFYQKQVSVYLEAKEKLAARKTKLIKLMVGDRQEKYKKEAALKKAAENDPSNQMATLRARLEKLDRDLRIQTAIDTTEEKKLITADDLIGGDDES